MSSTQTEIVGTIQTLLSTELNSMASSSSTYVVGSAITLTSTGYVEGEIELLCGSASAMTINTTVLVWFLRAIDGTNYEDGSTTVLPTRAPDVSFIMRAVTSNRIIKRVRMPPGTFKVLLEQQTGQTWNSSGNTLKVLPVTYQFS